MGNAKLVGPDGITPLRSSTDWLETVSPFEVSSTFNVGTGLATVKMKQPGASTAFVMTPTEARVLGLRLLLESETAVCNAISMRMLLEPTMGGLLPEQAVNLLQVLGRGTREAHQHAEAEYQQQKRVTENAPGGTAPEKV